jgi:hypothetical protein
MKGIWKSSKRSEYYPAMPYATTRRKPPDHWKKKHRRTHQNTHHKSVVNNIKSYGGMEASILINQKTHRRNYYHLLCSCGGSSGVFLPAVWWQWSSKYYSLTMPSDIITEHSILRGNNLQGSSFTMLALGKP